MKTIIVTSDTFEQSQLSKAFFQVNVLEPEQKKGNEDFILENIDTGKTITGKMLMRKHGIK